MLLLMRSDTVWSFYKLSYGRGALLYDCQEERLSDTVKLSKFVDTRLLFV